MTFRIAQISDTHLSDEKPFFVRNFDAVMKAVAAAEPNLVLNSGDVSLDGAGKPADLAAARRRHDAFGLAQRFIPGNHDIGDSPDTSHGRVQAIDETRRAAYRDAFGPDWWMLDVPGWRIVALNAQLFGSELPAFDEQLAFLAEAASSARENIALFIHKPLFDASEDETIVGGRFVNPPGRKRLLDAFGAKRPALVACGHVHQFRETHAAGARHIWAPSTAYFIPDDRQPRYGIKEVGFVLHDLRRDGMSESRFVKAPGTQNLSFADYPEAYAHLH